MATVREKDYQEKRSIIKELDAEIKGILGINDKLTESDVDNLVKMMFG